MSQSNPWRESLAAAKANLLPGFFLQAVAVALVISYYAWPDARNLLNRLAEIKLAWGWWYSLIATAFFGGFIPYLFLRLNPATRAQSPASHGLFYVIFWAYKGLEVDALYRLQSAMFGDGHDVKTLVSKVFVDQFIYSAFWSAPFGLCCYHWKELGFGWGNLRRTSWTAYLRGSWLTGIVSTWCVWIPTVAVIYCLPSSLQVPLFNVVLCFFVLLWASLTRRKMA